MRQATTTRRRDDTDADPEHAATHLARWLAACSLIYAGYRAYYAVGGTVGMIGEPVSQARFRVINAIGSLLIVVFSVVLPLVAVHVRRFNRAVPVLGWIGAVGCVMHALVDITLRVLSLTGRHPTELPTTAWNSFDRRTADLQDLLLNEPWFLLVGPALGGAGPHVRAPAQASYVGDLRCGGLPPPERGRRAQWSGRDRLGASRLALVGAESA